MERVGTSGGFFVVVDGRRVPSLGGGGGGTYTGVLEWNEPRECCAPFRHSWFNGS